MLRRLAGKIVDWQIRRHYLPDGDRSLYEYGYETLLNQMINILISAAIAIWFRAPVAVFVFLVCYIPLRSFCGGYHARTNWGCSLISAILLSVICMAVRRIPQSADLLLAAAAFPVCGGLVFRFAPVEDSNKPLDAEETVRYRRSGRAIWLLEICAAALLYPFSRQAGLTIVLGHGIFSVVLYMGIVRNRRLAHGSGS